MQDSIATAAIRQAASPRGVCVSAIEVLKFVLVLDFRFRISDFSFADKPRE
jgi:hypothetical protein